MQESTIEYIQNDENTVFVGNKHMIKYVQAIQTQAQRNKEIIIKARGRNISIAVDVAEIVTSSTNKFLTGWEKKSVRTGTNGKDEYDRVSFIEIIIQKTTEGGIDHEHTQNKEDAHNEREKSSSHC